MKRKSNNLKFLVTAMGEEVIGEKFIFIPVITPLFI
jgi:hypothetical protein